MEDGVFIENDYSKVVAFLNMQHQDATRIVLERAASILQEIEPRRHKGTKHTAKSIQNTSPTIRLMTA